MVSENEKPIKYCEPARYELRGEDVAGLNWKRMQSNLEANAEQPGSKYPANAEQNQSDADADVEQMQYNQYPLNEKEKYTKEKEKRDLIINNNLYEIDKIDRGSMRGKGREEREKGERLLATLEESVRAFGLSTTRLSGDSRCTAMTDAGVQCIKNAAIRIDGKDYCLQHAQRDFAMMCEVAHYDFVPKDWWMVVYTWLNYKRERKESYKSTQSIKVFYNNLFKLSGGNPQTAKSIIEQSMANNWAGIFGLKTSIYGRSSPPAKPNPRFQVGNFENEESTI